MPYARADVVDDYTALMPFRMGYPTRAAVRQPRRPLLALSVKIAVPRMTLGAITGQACR